MGRLQEDEKGEREQIKIHVIMTSLNYCQSTWRIVVEITKTIGGGLSQRTRTAQKVQVAVALKHIHSKLISNQNRTKCQLHEYF